MTRDIWLVCGGRGYDDVDTIYGELDRLAAKYGHPAMLINGGASGADRVASWWAKRRGVNQRIFRAEWRLYGKAAGPRRNQEMLDKGRPHLVIAFPGGSGTADMLKRADAAGLEIVKASSIVSALSA